MNAAVDKLLMVTFHLIAGIRGPFQDRSESCREIPGQDMGSRRGEEVKEPRGRGLNEQGFGEDVK